MKLILNLCKYARKSEFQYSINVIMSLVILLMNNAIYISIFFLFLFYFKKVGLHLYDFILALGIMAYFNGVFYGIVYNISRLNSIIEDGKLDFYLSFPVHPLVLLATSKVGIGAVGDVFFSFLLFIFYFILKGFSWIILAKLILVLFFIGIFIIGIGLIWGSMSFWQERASLWVYYIFYSLNVLGGYPYRVIEGSKLLFVFSWLILAYPSFMLGQKVINSYKFGLVDFFFVLFCVGVFIIGIILFNLGLRKYSSGNLVLTNV